MATSVAVIGAYHATPVPDRSPMLEELVFKAAKGALADAAMTIHDIDSVVVSTADQAHGRVIESMVTAGSVGACGRDLTTVASSGEHAFVYAYLRLLAGQGRRILVVCWGKPSEAKDPSHAERLGADPFLLRPFGMTAATAAGLQACAYARRFGLSQQAVDTARDARWDAAIARGCARPEDRPSSRIVAWPLRADDLPRACDGAAAAVLAADDAAPGAARAAYVLGAGWATERYDLGSRDLSMFASLRNAHWRAWGGKPDLGAIGVVEVSEISTIGGFAALEALGLADPGEGARVAAGGRIPINPSGGNLPADAGNAAGFLRLLEAASQVRGRAGASPIESAPRTAIGATLHGYAGQGAVVARFGPKPRRHVA